MIFRRNRVSHKPLLWGALIVFSVAWLFSVAWAAPEALAADRRLTGLSINGANSVNESTSSNYTATAVFSDGTRREVTSSASWSENSNYATISGGVLRAGSVSSDQSLTITARYSSNGTSRSAQKTITILNASGTTAALTTLTVTGPSSVNEGATAGYKATATFSNGTTQDVTASATWSENSSYATISASGVLSAGQVTGNQSVTVEASATSGGVTKSGTLSVTIVDGASPPPPPPASGSHAGRFTTYEGTKTCLQCHRQQALEVHASEHYQWSGKFGAINDFCIYPDPNHIGRLVNVNGIEVDGGCGKCHAGLGAKPVATATPTDAQLENIDCLICHAPQYKRTVDPVTKAKFIPDEPKMGVTILEAALDIQKTSRGTCLNCHTRSGGGDNFKRGDIEEHHRAPTTRAFDVHMSPASLSGGDMHCTKCHTVSKHKIAGRGVDLRVQEGTRPDCVQCHTATPPHANSNINSRHLGRVHCTVCHIPTFAKKAPTDMFRDWSAPGELNVSTGLYDPARTMQANVTPQVRFWDGQAGTFYKFGTPAAPGANGRVLMAGPQGSITTPGAKLYPFKVHTARQPVDTVTRYLLPLKIGYFYTEGDLVNAVPYGQDALGWKRNPYDFQETERWMGVFHEVSPKENALGYNNACTTCHGSNTPRVPLKTLGYTAKKPTSDLCNDCHGSESYSFSAVHPRHSNEGYDCSTCHSFSKAP